MSEGAVVAVAPCTVPPAPLSFVSSPSASSQGVHNCPSAAQAACARRQALFQQYKSLKTRALNLTHCLDASSSCAPQLLRVHQLLAQLYPNPTCIRPFISTLNHSRSRMLLLRAALKDQMHALNKLDDAANLLLLISEHVALLISSYSSQSCPALQQSCSSGRLSCLSSSRNTPRARAEATRSQSSPQLSVDFTIPRNYKAKYLRKCSTLASDALAAAVDLSSYLARQVEARGEHALIPEIDMLCKPCLSIVDLPGGFTLIFRAEVLKKMADDATRLRRVALEWRRKQWLFCVKLKHNLSACRRSVQRSMLQVLHARARLAEQEFVAEVCAAAQRDHT
eukprot:TRINITY_DN173_c0_g1_i1.p4 TRINITY_DN173_c0_g1~~TRINITY_DN173_c0_g1_i1.p4  ORF type:complete len:338 (+),score=59.95 TRINITY_DN173_c0_g1_i1:801-1814(+)